MQVLSECVCLYLHVLLIKIECKLVTMSTGMETGSRHVTLLVRFGVRACPRKRKEKQEVEVEAK